MPTAPSMHDSRAAAHKRRSTFGLLTMTAVLFLFFAAAAAPSPLLPLLLHQWRFAPWLLTFAFAVYALAILLALLVAGRLSDHVGRRPVVLVAIAVEILALTLFASARDITVFVLARSVQGLATGAATGALSAAITDFAGERRSRLAATLSSIAPLAGLACGAAFAGLVAEHAANPAVPVFITLDALFAIGLVATAGTRESSSRRSGALRSLAPRVAVPVAARTAFLRAVPVAVAVWMIGGFYLSVVGETARSALTIHDELATSLLIGGLSGVGAVAVAAAQRMHARVGAVYGCLLILIGAVVDLLAVQVTSPAVLIVGTAVSGAGFGLAFVSAVALVIPLAHAHERAELFSAIYVVNYLAFGVPAIAAGLLIAPIGLPAAVAIYALAIAVVAAIAVAVQATAGRRSNIAHPTP